MFGYQSDDVITTYLDKDYVLSLISQEEIFSMVFGEIPCLNIKYKSPFRKDNNPNCHFSYNDDTLRFVDFAYYGTYHNGIHLGNMDCFSSVMIYYNIENLNKTLSFIYNNYLHDNFEKSENCNIEYAKREKIKTVISINERNFNESDKRYWSKYFISKKNLIEDNVKPVKFYHINTHDCFFRPNSICYSLGNFLNGRKKLYSPLIKNFITNCVSDDIGCITKLNPKLNDLLIITKSYKDCRVLRNIGYQSVWLQSEVIKPNDVILYNLCNRYNKIIIFFDNDDTGVKNSIMLSKYINNRIFGGINKCSYMYLPLGEKKDPSDFIYNNKSKIKHLINLINNEKSNSNLTT